MFWRRTWAWNAQRQIFALQPESSLYPGYNLARLKVKKLLSLGCKEENGPENKSKGVGWESIRNEETKHNSTHKSINCSKGDGRF